MKALVYREPGKEALDDRCAQPISARVDTPRSAKILVVDDDVATMMIISSTLKSAGDSVVPAYGGEDAIRKAKAQ